MFQCQVRFGGRSELATDSDSRYRFLGYQGQIISAVCAEICYIVYVKVMVLDKFYNVE